MDIFGPFCLVWVCLLLCWLILTYCRLRLFVVFDVVDLLGLYGCFGVFRFASLVWYFGLVCCLYLCLLIDFGYVG